MRQYWSRPADLEGGAFYRFLATFGIDPSHEQAAIATRYGTSPWSDAVFFLDDRPPGTRAAVSPASARVDAGNGRR